MTVDFENDLLLITAASGKQASALLQNVSNKWKRLRLNVSSAASKEKLEKQYPNAEVIQSDISDSHACKKLLEGVTACFLITPGFHPHETQCGYNIIDGALANKNSGGPFKHMVHSSVLHPMIRKMVNHDSKRYIEEYLSESGLPYTVIQPTHIMETTDLASLMKQDEPVMPRFWNPSTTFSMVCARDLGEAVANIFNERAKHLYATYELCSTSEPLSYNEVAVIISKESGKRVRLERKTVEEGAKMFATIIAGGNPDEASWIVRQGAARMFMYYNDKGTIGNPNVLEMLLGRKPLEYRDWVKMSVKELRG